MRWLAKNMAWLAAAAALAIPVAALAQAAAGTCPGGCMQGAGRGHHGPRMFDPKSVTTVQGDVMSVDADQGRRHQGVHLTLSMGSEKLLVVVGPSFFLDQQPVKLAQGDKIEVKGSRITWGDQPVLIAQEIKRGNDVLTLRDADGIPAWSRRAKQ